MKRVVVKLGSSVVADSEGSLRMQVLAGVCDLLAEAHRDGGEVIIVTSGAIARGMRVMSLPQRPSSIGALQAASAVGQGKLYRVYDELLREREVTSAQVLLTFFDMSARTHYLNARQTLSTLLEWRVLPVINENDTTATDEISFGDNDFLAAQVAVLVAADELVLLTDIDGLFTADPRLYPDAHMVAEVSDFASLDALEIGHTTSPLGSGGMRSKVVAAEMATAAGIPTVICNGLRREALAAVLAGERGGPGPAPTSRQGGPLQQLQAVAEVRQAVPGHARDRRRRGTGRERRERQPAAGRGDLGAWGVRRGRRRRDRGAAEDGEGQGRVLAKGICSYTAAELRQVAGLKSDAIRKILPRATDEAVHRDYLVVD